MRQVFAFIILGLIVYFMMENKYEKESAKIEKEIAVQKQYTDSILGAEKNPVK